MPLDVPEGVQAFNFWTISVMSRLWDEFPRPMHFVTNTVVVMASADPSVAGEPFGPSGQVQIFKDTMNWLIAENFLRATVNPAGAYAKVSLTTRGFSVLEEVPRAIASPQVATDKPLGTLMREASINQGAAVIAGLIKIMLGGLK